MALFSYDKNAWLYEATPIENLFLNEYLPSTPGDYLRVYLYIRMVALHPDICKDTAELAQNLHLDEEALFNALDYWVHQGLLVKKADNPPVFAIVPVNESHEKRDPMEEAYYTHRDYNGKLQACFGVDNLLHPDQYGMADDWINIYGYTPEAVLRAVELQVARSRSRKPNIANLFKQLNKRLAEWADKGLRTADDIERAFAAEGTTGKVATLVAKTLGIHRSVTKPELALADAWVNELKLTDEEILDACNATVRTGNPSFGYVDSVLRSRVSGDAAIHDALNSVLRELGTGARVTPDAMSRYKACLDAGFDHETVHLAAVQCARRNRRTLSDVQSMLAQWKKMGLTDLDAITDFLKRSDGIYEELRSLLDTAGSDRRPSKTDQKYLEKWKETHSSELIRFAAECAQGADKPFAYMNKLLEAWAAAGITEVEAARAQHAAHAVSGSTATANPALNYEQRPADETDYSGLFVDLTEDPNGYRP